ncbi:MAG: iron ABC transporter substrate-binding protein [Candidatus Thermoplasmatota archaeon]|nr:iron ABC transporter substrate-binding protein [Candidatus Thermoplasmatota archaeon]
MKVWHVVILLISSSFMISAGCLDGNTEGTRTITDMLGREVEIPEKVNSVVGIEAGALRLLVYMQQADKVVGIEDHEKLGGAGGRAKPYTLANPGLLDLSSIGPMHGGDAELLVATQPDVVFWTYTDTSKADDLQTKTGIPVVALNYGDLNDNKQDLYDALELIGEVMGNMERAQDIESFIDGRIVELDNMTAGLSDPPSCYVGGIGFRGAHGMLSTEPAYSSLEFVNGNNVASSVGLEHAFIEKEKILDWNPEIIIIDEGGLSLALEELSDGTYDTIDAVRNGRLHGALPYNWYTTNFGTVIGNSYYIAKILHPDDHTDLDPVTEINDIYEFLVGSRVYQDMADEFGGFRELEI